MDSSTKVILVVLAIVVLGIPLLGSLARNDQPVGQTVPVAKTSASTSPAAGATSSPQSQVPQQSAPPLTGVAPVWNASNLPNTAWSMPVQGVGNVTVEFLPGGQVRGSVPGLPMNVSGTWQVSGTTITVVAMGKTVSAQIVGDQIMADGQAAQRTR